VRIPINFGYHATAGYDVRRDSVDVRPPVAKRLVAHAEGLPELARLLAAGERCGGRAMN
jgi:hypothetical protein